MKTLMRIAGFPLLLAGVAVLSYSEGRQHERDEAALMRTDRDFQKVAAERGAAGFASFFAEDAVVLMAGKPVVGPKGVEEARTPFFAVPGNRLDWEPTGAESEHDLGCTLGRYKITRMNDKGEKTISHGTYLTAWRRQPDKSWKVIFDGGAPDPASPAKP
jgi:ketosteroid isomerase-like protein